MTCTLAEPALQLTVRLPALLAPVLWPRLPTTVLLGLTELTLKPSGMFS